MCRYILHSGHLPISAGGRGNRRRASDRAKDAHTESFQHPDLGSVLFLLHGDYRIRPASRETVPSAMVRLRLGDWQRVRGDCTNRLTDLRTREKQQFRKEETLCLPARKDVTLPLQHVELTRSLAVETLHCIHEQAGLPILKPLFI